MEIKRHIERLDNLSMELSISLTEEEMESVNKEMLEIRARELFHRQLDQYLENMRKDDSYLGWLTKTGLLERGPLFLELYGEYRDKMEAYGRKLMEKLIQKHLPKADLDVRSAIIQEIGGNTKLVYGHPGGHKTVILSGVMTDGERKILNEARFYPEQVGLESAIEYGSGIYHVFYMQHAAILSEEATVDMSISDLVERLTKRGKKP